MTQTRSERRAQFLAEHGCSGSNVTAIAGDASARRYFRVSKSDGSHPLILMDAPPDTAGSMSPFIHVTEILHTAGLSAPEVYAANLERGFLLLEDLGDSSYTATLANDPGAEKQLYSAAVDVLVALRDVDADGLPLLNAQKMSDDVSVTFQYYGPTKKPDLDAQEVAFIKALFRKLSSLGSFGTMSLRDFHADNLIWRPDRNGVRRVGLLDYQDAVTTHPVYDIVSLLKDVRRDVPTELSKQILKRFCTDIGTDEGAVFDAAALVGLQRNLRILGVFARLSRDHGKRHYVDLIPRVWAHIIADLEHPTLSDLREPLLSLLPTPNSDHLNRLRQ